MPSWSVHLAIAKKINTKLNYNSNIFYFSNLIPDVDKDSVVSRFETHYYGNIRINNNPNITLPDYNKFYNEYKDNMDNPIIVGYLCHLMTDHYYNKQIYNKKYIFNNDGLVENLKDKNNNLIYPSGRDEILNIKHNDLENYGKYLYINNDINIPKYDDGINIYTNVLKMNILNIDNIKRRIKFLNSDFIDQQDNYINEYTLFKKEELDQLFNDCITFIIEELKQKGVIYE